jgi:hypothetical protein
MLRWRGSLCKQALFGTFLNAKGRVLESAFRFLRRDRRLKNPNFGEGRREPREDRQGREFRSAAAFGRYV